MTELSPAAQTVLDAFNGFHDLVNRRLKIAAALEAAADQVVPEPDDWDKDNFSIQALRLRCLMRDQLLAIAAELRGTITTETL
jgi:hypothetical protein